MRGSGILEEVIEGVFLIQSEKQYSEDVGLLTDNHVLEETWIV